MTDPRDPWDDDDPDDAYDGFGSGGDTFAALDFTSPDPHGQSSDVDEQPDGEADAPLFTVANPAGTVSVTTFLNGTVQRVDLAPTVARMTERQLADEILAIADLARQKAQSVVHAFVTETMGRFGYDTAALSVGLTRDLGMPTQSEATASMSRVFAQRYSNDRD